VFKREKKKRGGVWLGLPGVEATGKWKLTGVRKQQRGKLWKFSQ